MVDSTRRFSNRADDYVRYRPGYPDQLIEVLGDVCGLQPEHVIADVGSGTGKLTEVLLRAGHIVYGVEPNQPMRAAGERHLERFPNFRSVCGTAEDTTLPHRSLYLVTAAQAFHWFDAAKCRREFRRILQEPGWVALVWNDRQQHHSPFLDAYESLLQEFASDYNNSDIAAAAQAFLGDSCTVRLLPNSQELDWEGLRGRLLSSSYAPVAGQPGHDEMMRRLHQIFDEHQDDGRVCFTYTTRVFCGVI